MHQLDAVNLSAGVASVDAHLDMLRPAIASYGAKVEVRRIGLSCTISDGSGHPSLVHLSDVEYSSVHELSRTLQVPPGYQGAQVCGWLASSGLLCCAECVDCLQVLEVEQGVCKVRFEGPPPIGMGVQAAIKDKFPDIRNVELV